MFWYYGSLSRFRGRNKGTKGNGPGGSLGNAKADHVDIGEKSGIDTKLVVRTEWTGMRWTCGKWKMALEENGFISRNPARSCGGWNVGHGSATRLGHRATSWLHSRVICFVSAWSTLPAYSPVAPLEIKHRPNIPTTDQPTFPSRFSPSRTRRCT